MIKTSHRDDGVGVVHMDEFVFPIFCPSRKRESVLLENPMFEYMNIVVDHEERESYEHAFRRARRKPLSILTHNTYGCSRIRNYIVSHWYKPSEVERFNFQIDDDFRALKYIMSSRSRESNDPEYLISLIAHVGRAALDAGSGLFYISGSIMSPRERMSFMPFYLRRWAKTGFSGWIDPDLRMDENLITCDDLDLALQSIAKHKIMWVDQRWLGVFDEVDGRMRGNVNGDSVWISEGLIRKEQLYLARKWGTHVVHVNSQGWRPGQGYKIMITVPLTYEESIRKKGPSTSE